MARKDLKFEARITTSGSNGVAIYLPSHIVKTTELRERINEKVQCVLDEDGDIIVYLSDDEDDDEED